jgi:hypothetical protein
LVTQRAPPLALRPKETGGMRHGSRDYRKAFIGDDNGDNGEEANDKEAGNRCHRILPPH